MTNRTGGSKDPRVTRAGWWGRRPLAVQAIVILALAIGPLMVSLSILGVNSERDRALNDKITEHREARVLQTELLKEMVDAETGVRGFLLARDRAFLEPYVLATSSVPQRFERLQEHAMSDGGATLDEAEDLADSELQILSRLVNQRATSRALLVEGKTVMDRFRSEMSSLIAAEEVEINEAVSQRVNRARSTRTTLIIGGATSALGAVLGGSLLLAGIVRRLRIVTENARRVAAGEELEKVRGDDEIAQLAHQLERSAQLLRSRDSELRQAKEEADRANQAKSDFISRMSHELRTPLNAILGFAQILRDDAEGETAADIGQILRAGRHLLSLINEVLDLSRIESGTFAISLEPVSLREIVDESVELMAPLAGPRGITLAKPLDLDPSLHVLADRQRLKQVFLNLLSNAVKYNRDSGSVELSYSTDNDRVRLHVRDSGPGISEASRKDLFVPFARLGAETTEVEGTGLGLALSLRLVQMMEGDMDIGHSGPDGSEFWLELKAAHAHPAVEPVEMRNVPARRDIRSESAISILQVEDNPTNIRLLERILSRRPGIRLVTVQQGGEAVAAATMARPAVILLDVNLPDISGREVLARLRAEPGTASIPVIMLSADASPRQIDSLLASGAAAYVTKPLDISHFLSVLDDILQGGQMA